MSWYILPLNPSLTTWIKLIFYLETELCFMLILFPLVNVIFIRLFDPFSNKNKTSFIGWGWGLRFSSRSPLLSAPSSIPQNSIFQTLDRLVPSFCPSVYFRDVCLSIFVKKRQIIKLKRLYTIFIYGVSCLIHNFTLLPDQEDEWDFFVIPTEIWLFLIKALPLKADSCCRIKKI